MSTTSVKASSSARNALEGPDTSSIARLLHQYGCGPIPFVGSGNAFYEAVKESDLAGQPITAKLTRTPGNNAPIGGLKVAAGSGWFAARPSGTENIYKIYAENFKSREHPHAIVREAQVMVSNALDSPGFGAQTGAWQ